VILDRYGPVWHVGAAVHSRLDDMRIAQFSDVHLRTGPLAGPPAVALDRALSRLLALEPRPDVLVVTGDLTDNGHPDEYAMLEQLLAKAPMPVHLVTGNHDDPAVLVERFGGTGYLGDTGSTRYVVRYPQLTLIVADSWVEGSPAGRLGPDQLSWLDTALGERPGVPAMVCVHHPPVPVGIPFLDGMRLEDGDALGKVIGNHRNVVRVLAGHVHGAISASFAGTVVSVGPSTLRQAALRMHDEAPPGYVYEPAGFLLHLLDGPNCATHVVQVSHTTAAFAY
jgi:Icc protein